MADVRGHVDGQRRWTGGCYTVSFTGTNFNDAVLKGISLLQTVTDGEGSDMNRASMIIMLTDGEPTSGNIKCLYLSTQQLQAFWVSMFRVLGH